MKEIIELIKDELKNAFTACEMDEKYAMCSISNRPDLCQYQCNGAMAAAKEYHKAPIAIANEVVEKLAGAKMFAKVEACPPGFINIDISNDFLADYVSKMSDDELFGLEKEANPKTIIVDFGGPNVAKPLHVGHLRSAIIGESIKRILKYMGNNVIGDVHIGDWGLQMGLIIHELSLRKPDLVYYDESYEGEYPKEAPFTISELEEIYPCASGKSKATDENGQVTEEAKEYKAAALAATAQLQAGRRGYRALLQHILDVSVTDLKRNYENLNVSFELWKGESDAQPYIPDMVDKMKKDGFAYISEGALVVDVKEETDTKEVPPCMILKSDGASLYNTTDLATLVWRVQDYNPDHVIYVVDKRQDLYFTQVFRCAKKTGIVPQSTDLTFVGFGTMNGKDGKPFKTREGGVMRLEYLINEVNEKMLAKIKENDVIDAAEADETAKTVALAAIKYGDLSNQASKDYVFDVDRFTSNEGNTGPYILYTIVRMKSILAKASVSESELKGKIVDCDNESMTELMLEITKLSAAMKTAYEDLAPHRICAYIYDLCNAFNHFYHETKILQEENETKRNAYLALLNLTKKVLEQMIDLLGFAAPERM